MAHDDFLLSHMNTLWPVLIVSELMKSGIDTYFVSPGNRNVPIMAALGAAEKVSVKTCLDERAAAYRALGYAKAAGKPGVLVCTSGTAAANYFPALIEAFRDEVPMIAWSADRPPELVGADANQTIDQQGLFGRFVRKSFNLPCPDLDYPISGLLARICDLASVTDGPVHINLPFREPLLPVPEKSHALQNIPAPVPFEVVEAAKRLMAQPNPRMHRMDATAGFYCGSANRHPVMERVGEILAGSRRGLLVVGRPGSRADAAAIMAVVEKWKWPIYCDIASGLKGLTNAVFEVPFFDHPEAIRFVGDYDPDVIVQFGTALVSKAYYGPVLKGGIQAPGLIQVSARKGLRDPSHSVDIRLDMTASQAVSMLSTAAPGRPEQSRISKLASGFEALWKQIDRNTPDDTLSHPLIAKALFDQIPGNEVLFAGNSLVVRAFDMVLPPLGKPIDVVTNRGVSGIEGNVATAVGYAEAVGRRTTAVLGDISLLHDLNSLMLAAKSEIPVIVTVINNSGGRIFDRLPVAVFPGIPGDWVTMAHACSFEKAAGQFDLPYYRADDYSELHQAYREALKYGGSALLEIRLSPEADLQVFRKRITCKC